MVKKALSARGSKKALFGTEAEGPLDSAAFRRLAAAEKNPRIARRLRVMALLAEGIGPIDAGVRERITDHTVREWRKWYQRGGLQALLRRPPGRQPWLSEEQTAKLAAIIRDRPAISSAELCALVKERFGVAYRERSLESYVARRLGFMRHEGRFWGWTGLKDPRFGGRAM